MRHAAPVDLEALAYHDMILAIPGRVVVCCRAHCSETADEDGLCPAHALGARQARDAAVVPWKREGGNRFTNRFVDCRFPGQPLLDAIAAKYGNVNKGAIAVGVSFRTLLRLRHEGVSWIQADRWSVRFGMTPDEVWGPLWDEQTAHIGEAI